jgi:hemoglobin
MTTTITLYERLGGQAAISAAVDLLYDKILKDERVNGFFAHTDMAALGAHQKAFLTMAFGGPNEYTGRNMRDGHRYSVRNGLNGDHFDIVVGHIRDTLSDLNVPADAAAEVLAAAEGLRGDVLNT